MLHLSASKLPRGGVSTTLSAGTWKASIKLKIKLQTVKPMCSSLYWMEEFYLAWNVLHQIVCIWQWESLLSPSVSVACLVRDLLQIITGLDLNILQKKKIEIAKDPGQQFSKIFCLPQLSQRIWTELFSILVLIKNLPFKLFLRGG